MAASMINLARLLFILVIVAAPTTSFDQSTRRVDLNLVIAIDCSYSVNNEEFFLQTQGTAKAFTHPAIVNAILSGNYRSAAVTMIQWAGENNQQVVIPWRILSSQLDAYRLAVDIRRMPRLVSEGSTSITAAIDAGIQLLKTAPYKATRYVIDISADGINNDGSRVDDARDRAIAEGLTVNGLPILNEVWWLHYYFENHIIGGLGAFYQISNSYADYGQAIRKKLLREISGNTVS